MSKSRIAITIEAQGVPDTMIGKTTVAAVIADALRTAFANKDNTIAVQSLDGDFHQAFERITEQTGGGPLEMGDICPEILILDHNGHDCQKDGHEFVIYQVERNRDTNVNSANIVSVSSSTATDSDGNTLLVGERPSRRAQFTDNPDDQQAVRDFLNAHPDREAADGGRLG